MKIAAAQFIQPVAQASVGAALAGGETVSAPVATSEEAAALIAFLNSPAADAFLDKLKTSRATSPVLALHPAARRELSNIPGFTPAQMVGLGVGTGTMTGLGAGLLVEALRAVAPRSAVALTIGAALVGAGIGGALGARIVTRVKMDPKGGVELEGAGG